MINRIESKYKLYKTKIFQIEMLRQYEGPRLELGMAEQFVLLLSDLPDYTILLEGHMMRSEFDASVKRFKLSLNTMINLAKLILNSGEFKQLMHLILNIGNYLNYVRRLYNLLPFTRDFSQTFTGVLSSSALVHIFYDSSIFGRVMALFFFQQLVET